MEHGLGGRVVVLLAAFPPEKDERLSESEMLASEEAILSLCRAVFDAGGSILVRATREIAPLVAEISQEYEGRGQVLVLFTEPVDEELSVELMDFPGVERLLPGAQEDLVEQAVAAVVIGDADQTMADREALAPNVEIYVIGGTGPELGGYDDVVMHILGGPPPAPEEIPYPYLMQELVDRWSEMGQPA